jgi:release factor glutamine methyltransferase
MLLYASVEQITRRLAAAGCVAASEEAEELVAAAPDLDTLEGWLAQREAGVPLAWITGGLLFAGHRLTIDPGVYVPRAQSEELARRAAAMLASRVGAAPNGEPVRAADLCTGAGAIAAHLAAAVPEAIVVGVDVDGRAARCAHHNGVFVVVGDVGAPLRAGVFDLVTAVAPYVPRHALALLPSDVQRYEPRLALDGGDDGLIIVRRAVEDAARLLRAGGWLLLEVGGEQDEALAPALAQAGFVGLESWCDEEGDLRGVAARLAG